MPVRGRDTYFFRGQHPERSAAFLETALSELVQYWNSQPSLVVHHMGNLVIELVIGSESVTVEITDPLVLADLTEDPAGPMAVLDYLVDQMGIDQADAMMILENAAATVRVDVIADPADPDAWRPGVNPTVTDPYTGQGYGATSAAAALPDASSRLLGELLREADVQARRDPHRRRSRRGRELLDVAVRTGRAQGLSDAELARRTGIPRTTLRDARVRTERQERVAEQFKDRQQGQRMTRPQQEVVLEEIIRADGNAAEAARRLGLAPRTVREIRARAQSAARARGDESFETVPPETVRRSYTAQDRSALISLVRDEQVTATEAGRRLGVPVRTARDWVRAARFEE